jgi:hypothetical protein
MKKLTLKSIAWTLGVMCAVSLLVMDESNAQICSSSKVCGTDAECSDGWWCDVGQCCSALPQQRSNFYPVLLRPCY